MEHMILKLVEEGWNVANGGKSPVAWLDKDEVTPNQLSTAKIIAQGEEAKECNYTNTVVYSIDYPKDKLKGLLTSNKILPANYNELELIAKHIKA